MSLPLYMNLFFIWGMATSTWKADMWEMYVHIYIPLLAVLDCFEREDLAHFSKELRVKENKQEVKKTYPPGKNSREIYRVNRFPRAYIFVTF